MWYYKLASALAALWLVVSIRILDDNHGASTRLLTTREVLHQQNHIQFMVSPLGRIQRSQVVERFQVPLRPFFDHGELASSRQKHA